MMKCQSELDIVADEGCENDAVVSATLVPFGAYHLCRRCLDEYIERGVEVSPVHSPHIEAHDWLLRRVDAAVDALHARGMSDFVAHWFGDDVLVDSRAAVAKAQGRV